MSHADWIASKLSTNPIITNVRYAANGNLWIDRAELPSTLIAPIAAADRQYIRLHDLSSHFSGSDLPSFAVSVPSKPIWTGEAITLVRANRATFGRMSVLEKALDEEDPSVYPTANHFFENGLRQHSHVNNVELVYECVFRVFRNGGKRPLTIALIDAYEMSAEDVRNCCAKFAPFDIGVKKTSYGGITTSANQAANSIGIEVLMWRDLLSRLQND